MSAGWKKNCSCAKRCGQLAAQIGDESRRRRVLLLQGDQDLAIHRAHGGGIAQGDVDAAVGQADVVEHDVDLVVADDMPNLRLRRRRNMPASSRGAFRAARARAGASGRHRPAGRNPGPAAGTEQGTADHQNDERRNGRHRLRQRPGQRIAILLAERLEASFEAVMDPHQGIRSARRARRPADAAVRRR